MPVPLLAVPTWLRGRLHRLSLRQRLVVVLLTLLLISCAGVAVVTSVALRGFLLQRLDQQLVAAGTRYSGSLEHPSDNDGDETPFTSVVGQPAGTLGARILNGSVTAIGVIGGGTEQPEPTAADKQRIAVLVPSPQAHTVRLPGLGEYRVIVSSGRDGDVMVTGLPESSVDETVSRLVMTEAIVFAIALIVTGVLGALSVRLSLRPLDRVTRIARRVSALPLASGAVLIPERVPDAAPETEVGKVTEAFNHMLANVEFALSERQASEDQLRLFIADASHELRTPVAVIRSHTEYAQHVAPELPVEVERSLSRIAAESERMGRLVDDLLLLARLDSGVSLEREGVDLTRAAMDAVLDVRMIGADHHWQLALPDEPVGIIGDQHRLHQAIANLLANALTHTPPGTTIITELIEDSASDSVDIVVRDDGPGIPASILPVIFERFVRADASRSHTSGGTGLGLSIVDAIVRAHDGTVTVTSEPGRTEFRIRLPAARVAQTQKANAR
jgi:two-component system OmpR family sensor kinase